MDIGHDQKRIQRHSRIVPWRDIENDHVNHATSKKNNMSIANEKGVIRLHPVRSKENDERDLVKTELG